MSEKNGNQKVVNNYDSFKRRYNGNDYSRDVFRIFIEQMIIRNACERYYPKQAILKNEQFSEMNFSSGYLDGKTILDNLKLAQEMTEYLKDWYYQKADT